MDTKPVNVAGKPWWKKPYRIVQTNLRLTDASLDPQSLARTAREFGATALTFNVGGIYSFYPTQLSLQKVNPFLTRDLTGDMLKAARQEGLRMIGRYDLSKGTDTAYAAHPEWFVHNKKGEPQEYNGTYQACVNGGWAGYYSLEILRESLSLYDLDGVFFNMTGYRPFDYSGKYHGLCWCENCREGFATLFGRTLPEQEDFSDPAYRDYLTFKERTTQAAARRLYETVKSVRPNTGVMGNGRGPCDFLRLELQRAIERPAPEWPHQAGELTRWAEAFGRGKPYACASTNFLDYRWRFASETPSHHLLRFGQQLAGGGQTDYYLMGTFEQQNAEAMESIREFMTWKSNNEQHFIGTRSVARVALYHSRATNLHASATATGDLHLHGFRGAYRLLVEGRMPFNYISDERMSDPDIAEQLAPYEVIVMPNVACLSDQEVSALDAFVARGGTIIATGETGAYDEHGRARKGFALKSFPAKRITFAAPSLETYIHVKPDELAFPRTRLLHLHGWYFHVEKQEDTECLLTLLPEQKYGPPELCFPTVPPGDNPGVIVRHVELGRTVYLPWLPEWQYFRDGLPEHRELFLQLITEVSRPIVKLEGAGPLEIAVRAKDDRPGERIIHIVNYAGQRHSAYEEPPAITSLRLGIRDTVGPARALVSETMIDATPADPNGYAWFDVPAVKHFEIIVLSRAKT